MVLFAAIGLLMWIGFLFAAWVLCMILWLLCQSVVWLFDLGAGRARRTRLLLKTVDTASPQGADQQTCRP